MSEQRQHPAVEDFDFIRTRLDQLKKEREEADKASNAPVMQPVFENDYCVGMASAEQMNLASYNSIQTSIELENYVRPDNYPMYDFLELDEDDNVIGFEKAVRLTATEIQVMQTIKGNSNIFYSISLPYAMS